MELEGGMNGFVFVSGMVVVFVVFFIFFKGDYFIIVKDVYGGMFCLVE